MPRANNSIAKPAVPDRMVHLIRANLLHELWLKRKAKLEQIRSLGFPKNYSTELIREIQQWGFPWIRTGAVIWRVQGGDFQFLLIHEAKVNVNGHWQPGDGGWNLPCGRLNLTADQTRAENLYEAAEREVFEESGQVVELQPVVDATQRTDLNNFHILLLFGAELTETLPFTPTDEVSEIGWFTYDETKELRRKHQLRSPDMVFSALDKLCNMSELEYKCGLRPTIRQPKQSQKP